MGEASLPQKDLILCLLPFPETVTISDRIRKNHPNVELIYKQISFDTTGRMHFLPDGTHASHSSPPPNKKLPNTNSPLRRMERCHHLGHTLNLSRRSHQSTQSQARPPVQRRHRSSARQANMEDGYPIDELIGGSWTPNC